MNLNNAIIYRNNIKKKLMLIKTNGIKQFQE